METFGQNLVFEADASILTPLAVSVQSLAVHQPQIPVQQTDRESVSLYGLFFLVFFFLAQFSN